MALLLIGIGLVGIVAGLFWPPGTAALMLLSGGCAFFNCGLNGFLWKWDRRYMAYKFFVVFNILQPVFFFALLLFFGSEVDNLFAATDLWLNGVGTLLVSFSLLPVLGVLLAGFLEYRERQAGDSGIDFVGHRLRRGWSFFIVPKMGPAMHALLIISAVINLITWVSDPLNRLLGLPDLNIVSVLLHALARALVLMPLVAGLYWNRNRLVQIIWLVQLAVGLFLAVITGQRSVGFFSVAYYGLGVILQQPTLKRRLATASFGVVCGLVLVLLGGFVQNMRGEFGRTGDLQAVKIGEIMRNLDMLMEQSKNRSALGMEAGPTDALWNGLTRLIDWTQVLVPNMTPAMVPYRGYDDFGDELMSMTAFPGLGINRSWVYDNSMLPRPYGFNTNTDIDEKGNYVAMFQVPFGTLADSWSRGGMFSAIFQMLFACVFLCLVERLLMRWFLPNNSEIFVLGRMIIIGMAVGTLPATQLIPSIRNTFVSLGYSLPVVWLLTYWLSGHVGGPPPPPGHRSPIRPGRPVRSN